MDQKVDSTFASSSLVLWTEAVEHTRRRSPASFEQWFSSVQLDSFDGRVVRLAARDEFVRDWVKTHFLPELLAKLEQRLRETAVSGEHDGVVTAEWRVDPALVRPICVPAPKPAPSPSSRPPGASRSASRPSTRPPVAE